MAHSTRLVPARPATAVETSMNTKLGPISATYSSQASCPRSCPWYRDNPDEAPCYANHGRSVYTTRRLNRSQERNAYRIALAEAKAIDGLTGDRLLRLHVVGDCRTNASARVLGAAARRYSARGNHPRSSWTDSVSVLASVERIHDAREAMKRGYAAAIVVGEFQQEQAYPVEGLTVIPCPNQTKGITCRECGLCRNDQRLRKGGLVIAFQAHGRQAASMRKTLMSLSVVLGRIAS